MYKRQVFVLVDTYILLEEQFQFGFSCFFGGLYYFVRFLGSGVYTFQRHFLLDVVAERAADAQVYVLELDGFGAEFLFRILPGSFRKGGAECVGLFPQYDLFIVSTHV